MEAPFCTILVVNFNGKKHLDACLSTLEDLDYPAGRFEVVVVDNGSEDGSEREAEARHPGARVLHNPKNNFAAALNLGVASSSGEYVAFCNNDVFMERRWLAELVRALEANPRAGCAGGKILFEDGRINSIGHRTLPDFYWEDDGYGEEDRGQYDAEREVAGLCWAAVLFRRGCLEELGPIDEDFVMYYEDVDTSERCRKRGWKFLYTPGAVVRHVFHGSSSGTSLAEFFSDRSRLIYVAKHHPDSLPRAVRTSRFISGRREEALYDALPVLIKKLVEIQPRERLERILSELCDVLVPVYGSLAVEHLMARMQVVLGARRMSVGFYDQALHVIGGGQKFGCTVAAALQAQFDVTLMTTKPVARSTLEGWYGLRLSECDVQLIPLPFFEQRGTWIDPAAVPSDAANPFEAVSERTQKFDVFFNVNMLTMVRPFSPFSIFLCHFPETLRRTHFAVDDYSCLLTNSKYTSQWVRALWGCQPAGHLYPPVDMAAPPAQRDLVILSAARFEPGGSKMQHKLIRAFEMLRAAEPELLRGWRLALVGGSLPQNPYLEEIQRLARESGAPVEIHVNVPFEELQGHYARASIFWHACGLGQTNPHLVEHFGMTTVEAMQNRCVPIVINGGGQKEIVEHGVSGFRFDTLEELCRRTRQVISTPGLAEQMGEAAFVRAQQFSRERFDKFVRDFFSAIEEEYRTIRLPDPRDILNNRRPANLFYSPLARRMRPLLAVGNGAGG